MSHIDRMDHVASRQAAMAPYGKMLLTRDQE
jgi:hypothetical protein